MERSSNLFTILAMLTVFGGPPLVWVWIRQATFQGIFDGLIIFVAGTFALWLLGIGLVIAACLRHEPRGGQALLILSSLPFLVHLILTFL